MPLFSFSYALQIPQLLALANFLLSWLWYSPVAPWFNAWAKAAKLNPDPKKMSKADKARMPMLFAGGIVSSFLISGVLQLLVRNLQAASFLEGARVGFFLALGAVVPSALGSLWEGRHGFLAGLTIANYFFILCLFGGVLAVWR